MDELDVLARLPGPVVAPDRETRDRMRAPLEERMGASGPVKRRGRRSALMTVLMAAGISIGGAAAAATLTHLWTNHRPVAIHVSPGSRGGEGPTLIANGDQIIATPQAFEATVSRFTQDIRLPEGHDYGPWVAHVERITNFSSPNGTWRRFNVPVAMVFVAQCQWSQHWHDGNASGDVPATNQATHVMGGIRDWSQSAGLSGAFDLSQQMRDGDVARIQRFVGLNCGGTGAIVGTPTALDAIAQHDLARGFQVAEAFARTNDGYAGFNEADGQHASPMLTWVSYRNTNPASAGMTNIEVAQDERLLMTQESETGTVYCVEAVGATVIHGEVPAEDVAILHRPEPGSHPEVRCTGSAWQSP